MAVDVRTHLLVVNYDEDQRSLLKTFGVSKKDLNSLMDIMADPSAGPEDDTVSARMMRFIADGKLTGGDILFLAASQILSLITQRQARSMLRDLMESLLDAEDSDDNDESDDD